MKKKASICVIVIVLIVGIIYGMYLIDMNRMKNNKSVIFSTWGYSYTPPLDIKEYEINNAIINYLAQKGDSESKHHENEKTFANMKVFLLEEIKRDEHYNVYAWVLNEKYYLEDGELKEDSGSSIPCKFVVKNIDGKFEVTDSESPRDGSYYSDDMKKIFPSSVRNDMNDVHTDGTIEKLHSDIEEQATAYFYEILKNNTQKTEFTLINNDIILNIGSEIKDFPKEPISTTEDSGDGYVWDDIAYDDIQIRIVKNTEDNKYPILEMTTTSNNYETPRGIKVGDNVEALKEAYSKYLTYEYHDELGNYYIFDPEDDIGFRKIKFCIANNVITKIIVYDGIDG